MSTSDDNVKNKIKVVWITVIVYMKLGPWPQQYYDVKMDYQCIKDDILPLYYR